MTDRSAMRAAMAALAITFGTACASAGGLGNVLGSVLGGAQQQQGSQATGTVQGVDQQSHQISLQQSDGSAVALAYDNNTKVVYQNTIYAVTNLERGDQISARVQQTNNGGYYTDSIEVTQSTQSPQSSGSNGSVNGSETVQTLQGVVRQVDRNGGTFSLDAGTGVSLLVSMPYGASRSDVTRFNNLRIGDRVQIQGVYLNNTRVELRRFY